MSINFYTYEFNVKGTQKFISALREKEKSKLEYHTRDDRMY